MATTPMPVQDQIKAQIDRLIEEGSRLSVGHAEYAYCRDGKHITECVGWLTAAHHLVSLICPSSHNAYRMAAERIDGQRHRATANSHVGELTEVLRRLSADIDNGLLASVANQAAAETFDDFLDHAEAYRKQGQKNEAGVIGGIVFEDTIRRICREHGIDEAGAKLDGLISELANREVITGTKAKRARSAADVRNKAAHAQWDEFDERDVASTIDLTRELLATHLEG